MKSTDYKANKKRLKLSFLLQIALGILLGMTILRLTLFAEGLERGEGLLRLAIFIIFVLLAVFLQIYLHELGHLLGGKIAGYRLMSFRIGPLAWNYENGKLHFSLLPNKGYGGLCAMLPPAETVPRYKEILYYSGGLLANFSTSLFALGLYFFRPEWPVFLRLFLISFALIGLALGLINALPFESLSLFTDGKIIWGILGKKPFASVLIRIQSTIQELAGGRRPRELDLPPLEIDGEGGMLYLYLLLYHYFRAVDSGEEEKANELARELEKELSSFPPPLLPPIYYELTYRAAVEGEQEKARKYYAAAGSILQRDKDINGLRVKAYYVYYIDRNLSLAGELCREALEVWERFPLRGQALMERDLITELQKRIAKEAEELEHPNLRQEEML